jgi:hypothetical protein
MKYLGLLVLALIVLAGCAVDPGLIDPLPVGEEGSNVDETILAGTTNQEACESAEGNWIASAQECEGISPEYCQEIGGNFNECASACRNDPDATICTMQCVLVCEFGTNDSEPISVSCPQEFADAKESNDPIACTREFMPVCGLYNKDSGIVCIKAPCGEVFSNKCTACSDTRVDSYIEDAC